MFEGDPYFAAAELSKLLGTDVPSARPDEVEGAGLTFGDVVFSTEIGGPPVDEVEPGETLVVRVNVSIGPHWIGQIDNVRVVIMGVGDLPIWAMTAESDALPTAPGDWVLDFVVRNAPVVRGRFVAATQLSRASGEAIAVSRSTHAFGIIGSHRAGMMGVPYDVRAHAGSLA